VNGIDEQALIQRALRGDSEAFGDLVQSHGRPVYNLALRMVGNAEDARDLTQTTFLKAWEKLESFDRRGRFFSWVYRIALNECLNHRRARRDFVPLDEEMPGFVPGPEQDYDRRREIENVQQALLRLNPADREVLVFRHFLGLSHQEIGEVLEIAGQTVKSRLHTALVRLETELRKRGVGAR
jgi:RNA polymerase sigma-70 factor (ECF subfamily)